MKGFVFELSSGKVFLQRPHPQITKKNALSVSIAKWQFIVDCLMEGQQVYNDGGMVTCGLCQVHLIPFPKYSEECVGCPVFSKTGAKYCRTSPYSIWKFDKTLAHAQAELDFLKSLRRKK